MKHFIKKGPINDMALLHSWYKALIDVHFMAIPLSSLEINE